MKTLESYIENYNINSHIDEVLFNELLLIYEGTGVYDGCLELAEHISSIVIESENDIEIINTDNLKFPNIFTKDIYVHINRNAQDVDGKYVISKDGDDYDIIRYDEASNKFIFIEIKLYIPNEHVKYKMNDILVHELTHAYDDFMHISNKGRSLKYRIKNSIYNKIDIKDTDDDYTFYVKKMTEGLSKHERLAYVAQVSADLEHKYFDTYKDAYDYLKKCNSYNNIKGIRNFMLTLLSDEHIDQFKDAYNKLFDTKKSSEQIKKEYMIKLNNYWKSAINHIYNALSKTIRANNRTELMRTNFVKEMLERLNAYKF